MRFPGAWRNLESLSLIDISRGCERSLNIASPEDVVTLIFVVAYRRGDVNVHCIASPEDVVTLIFVVAYRRGGCRGWGDVNVHGIASPEVVVTLKMLSR